MHKRYERYLGFESHFLLSLKEKKTHTHQADPSLSKRGSAGVYGMVGKIPDKTVVKDFILEFFNELYSL